MAGRVVDGTFRRGFLCWGVPVGEKEFVEDVLREKVDGIVSEARGSLTKLQDHKQAAWALLKWSVWQRFDYWAGLCYPSDSLPAARSLDEQLHSLLEDTLGFKIPTYSTRETSGWDCPLSVPVPGRNNLCYSSWILRQPIKLGGFGLRSYEELCRPAYVGVVEQTLPRLHQDFCPMLAPVVGGAESFGRDGVWEGRWQVLVEGGCTAGQEFNAAWQHLKAAAEAAAQWLGGEVTGPLKELAESAGEGRTNGETRSLIIENREKVMGQLLDKALQEFPDQSCRPVWAQPQKDKHSTPWLLCLPGHDNSLNSAEFTQCAAAQLCVPSPACLPKVGERVGRQTVDIFGDRVVAARMAGDGYRRRHDGMKNKIKNLHKWAGLEHTCEVFNLFAGYIPQAGLARIERGRKRQGLVPDFKVRAPVAGRGPGETEETLAELKVISCCPTRYLRHPHPVVKAVDARSALLPGEYNLKAKKVDRRFGDVPVDRVGPVQAKLQSFPPLRGWVTGAWGEASVDVHTMVQDLASSRLRHQETLPGADWMRKGRKSEEAERGRLVAQLRRELSLEAVRGQARLLLDRLQGLGEGAAAAVRRRKWAEEEERRLRRERQAQALSAAFGRPLIRKGQFLLN